MTAKCIQEEHIHILKSLSLSRNLQGQKTAVTIRKIQTGFPRAPQIQVGNGSKLDQLLDGL